MLDYSNIYKKNQKLSREGLLDLFKRRDKRVPLEEKPTKKYLKDNFIHGNRLQNLEVVLEHLKTNPELIDNPKANMSLETFYGKKVLSPEELRKGFALIKKESRVAFDNDYKYIKVLLDNLKYAEDESKFKPTFRKIQSLDYKTRNPGVLFGGLCLTRTVSIKRDEIWVDSQYEFTQNGEVETVVTPTLPELIKLVENTINEFNKQDVYPGGYLDAWGELFDWVEKRDPDQHYGEMTIGAIADSTFNNRAPFFYKVIALSEVSVEIVTEYCLLLLGEPSFYS